MKFFRRILSNLIIDSALLYCFYLWKFEGVAGAGNIVQFVFWLAVALSLALLFVSSPAKINPKSKLLHAYGTARSFGFLAAFVWFGHYALAGGYVVAWLILEVNYSKYDDSGALKGVP